MSNPGPWLFVALLTIVAGGRDAEVAPLSPPQQRVTRVDLDRVITLHVEVDESFVAQHGDAVEEVVREAIAIHNLEWRRYRREWFQLGALTIRPSVFSNLVGFHCLRASTARVGWRSARWSPDPGFWRAIAGSRALRSHLPRLCRAHAWGRRRSAVCHGRGGRRSRSEKYSAHARRDFHLSFLTAASQACNLHAFTS